MGEGLTFLLAITVSLVPDTTVVIGSVERDLTGDGRPELIRLEGSGASVDSLAASLTIESADGELLYEAVHVPFTRHVGFDAGRRRLSEEEYEDYLREYAQFFFGPEKFQTPREFEALWTRRARHRLDVLPATIADEAARRSIQLSEDEAQRLWEAIRERDVRIFEFSPGGDGVVPLVWIEELGAFVELVACC